ncbi:hypothetical protein FRC03_006359 [Tulasnella sp. 419]|nr:hypothetical protein FRC02_003884 [Tulasnella sp. 418]KAG8939337.1 hypothetical protein FRC03_006359 [Tulasnella sp. 419]
MIHVGYSDCMKRFNNDPATWPSGYRSASDTGDGLQEEADDNDQGTSPRGDSKPSGKRRATKNRKAQGRDIVKVASLFSISAAGYANRSVIWELAEIHSNPFATINAFAGKGSGGDVWRAKLKLSDGSEHRIVVKIGTEEDPRREEPAYELLQRLGAVSSWALSARLARTTA